MNRKFGSNRCLVALVFCLLAACVTVNIYFPAAEVRKAAEDIVKDVRDYQKKGGDKENGTMAPSSMLFQPAIAYAGNELTVSNATIRQLKSRIKQRFPMIAPFMQMGAVGEGTDGFVKIRDLSRLNLKQKARLKKLVSAENSDRRALYQSVAQSLNIPLSQISRVQAIFAKEWQKTAPSGTFIEVSPGKWQKK